MVHDIQLEIILDLLKNGRNHVRNIAENIGKSHVEVIRKARELQEEGVVEYSTEGKNKRYSLKDNIASKNMIIMAEMYKTNKMMRTYPQLRVIFDEIIKEVDSELLVMFGSYAKGEADENSDIDIYIETSDKGTKDKVRSISRKANVKIGRLDKQNRLTREIIRNHVIIKGVERFYEFIEQA